MRGLKLADKQRSSVHITADSDAIIYQLWAHPTINSQEVVVPPNTWKMDLDFPENKGVLIDMDGYSYQDDDRSLTAGSRLRFNVLTDNNPTPQPVAIRLLLHPPADADKASLSMPWPPKAQALPPQYQPQRAALLATFSSGGTLDGSATIGGSTPQPLHLQLGVIKGARPELTR